VSSYNYLEKPVTETNDATPVVKERILKGTMSLRAVELATLQQIEKSESTKPHFAQL
jgi:hypothetical protein